MNNDKKHMFDNPQNVKRVLYGLFTSLVLLLAIEPFILKHPYFAWEEWFGFYAIYGFVACVLLVLVAKYILRPIVKREEDYYD
jgi:membrane protein YdbS with pleckstrin-like domain